MQIICTSLQTDNQASTLSLQFYTGRMLFLTPSQQHQGTEGNKDTKTGNFRYVLLSQPLKFVVKK